MELTRRDLLKTALAATGAVGLGGLAAGCSDDDNPPPKPDTGTKMDRGTPDTGTPDKGTPTPDKGMTQEAGTDASGQEGGMEAGMEAGTDMAATSCDHQTITNNHSHALMVPMADVTAGVEKEYSIQGTGTHDHKVTITAADFTKLKNNEAVTVTSTTDNSHSHDVTVKC